MNEPGFGLFCCQEFCPKDAVTVRRIWIRKYMEKTTDCTSCFCALPSS